jgi:hypothetical protein
MNNLLFDSKLFQFLKAGFVVILPVLLWLVPRGWLDGLHTICLFDNLLGHECYGCGITRAVLSVLHFDFVAAWRYNRLVVVVAPLLAWVWGKTAIQLVKQSHVSQKKGAGR